MKLETSIRNALKVAERIKRCNGIIGTPEATHEALRISRAWLFGSTIKGKINPNDTDILLEKKEVGRFNLCNAKKRPRYKARSGFRYSMQADEVAYSYLIKGTRKISLHDYEIDNNFGDINQTKIMIYPRMDLAKLIE